MNHITTICKIFTLLAFLHSILFLNVKNFRNRYQSNVFSQIKSMENIMQPAKKDLDQIRRFEYLFHTKF